MQTSYQPQPPGGPAAATRQFLLKTEFNAHETRIEEHMRDRLYARSDVKHKHPGDMRGPEQDGD